MRRGAGRSGGPAPRPGSAAGGRRHSSAMRLDVALDGVRRRQAITVQRRGSASMPRSAGGGSGCTPSASTMVAANLAGSAVSSTIIGTPGCRCSRATFRPSAVWVSIIVRAALPGVADGGQAVGMRAAAGDEAEAAGAVAGANSAARQREAAVARQRRRRTARACARASRPSRSKTKRSKLLALLMSIDGLEVSCVSALLRTR